MYGTYPAHCEVRRSGSGEGSFKAAGASDVCWVMAEPWLRVLTCDECRAFDARAMKELGIPSLLLMENASKNASDVAAALLEERHGMVQNVPVLIVCGSGNNGGDGYAMARHLTIAGARVRVLAMTPVESLKGDALVMARIARAMDVPIDEMGANAEAALSGAMATRPNLIIDAIFGTGLSRAVDGIAADLINAINASNITVLAIDVPSGLNADTGTPMGVAIRATATVTMAGLKPGLVRLEAQEFVGDLSVVDIGVPSDFAADLGTILDIEDASGDDAEEDDPDFGEDSDRSRERL